MSLRDWMFLLAALGHLGLALVCLLRAGTSPLALPLSFVAFDFFGWTFSAFCNHSFASPLWRGLDVVFTALAPPVVFHFVLAFVGKLRARRVVLRATYVAFGVLAASSMPAFFTAWGGAWIESRTWALLFLTGWFPTLIYETTLLVRHLRTGSDADEQARTRLVMAALLVGGTLASTDLWNDLGLPWLGLAPIGTLASSLLLAVAALRFRLFDRNVGRVTTLYAVSIAFAAVALYLTMFQGLRGHLPAMTFGVTVVTLLLTAVVRETSVSLSASRERVERLAVLGRFSAQMTHDLKNPLAALVGAVQMLETDTTNDREFRAMIVEQAARIRAIVATYDRLGRVEPVRTLVSLSDLVRRVTGLVLHARHSTMPEVTLSLELDDGVGESDLDRDLISGALENLLRNAMEAMQNGGVITVRTRQETSGAQGHVTVLEVEDTGEGMNARQAERAFDDFYTTKTTGSGLGLAFVRRVALAHGGDASLTSKRGFGTTVQIRLPGSPSSAHAVSR